MTEIDKKMPWVEKYRPCKLEDIVLTDVNKTILERKPLENLAKKKQLVAYKHKGFWHCVDTRRDRDNLEKILKNK